MAEKVKKDVMARLENLVLKDLVAVSEIYYDPVITETVVEADKDLIEGYYEIRTGDDSSNWSPWLLRFELDETTVVEADKDLIEGYYEIQNGRRQQQLVTLASAL